MNIKKELVKALKGLVGVYFGKVYSNDELKISERVIGGKVEAVNPDGSLAPVEDGDYAMEDGFAFTVKGGMIESIEGQEPVEQSEVTDDTPTSGTTEVEQAEVVEPVEAEPEVDNTDERLTALEEAVAEIKSMLESMNSEKMESAKAIEQFNSTVQELNNNIQTLAKVPVEFSKTNKTPVVEESKQHSMECLASLFAKNK